MYSYYKDFTVCQLHVISARLLSPCCQRLWLWCIPTVQKSKPKLGFTSFYSHSFITSNIHVTFLFNLYSYLLIYVCVCVIGYLPSSFVCILVCVNLCSLHFTTQSPLHYLMPIYCNGCVFPTNKFQHSEIRKRWIIIACWKNITHHCVIDTSVFKTYVLYT